MYCEITTRHQKSITAVGLVAAIRSSFGNDVPLPNAYSRSSIYKLNPPHASLSAFETVRNCFVILRKVNVDFSSYHLEGDNTAVSAETMLHATQQFSKQLLSVLSEKNVGSDFRVRALTVLLFEDNGREAGMEGNLVTLGSVVQEKFAWKELKSSIIPFFTSMLLIWLGLDKGPLIASIYSLLILFVFTLGDGIAVYGRERGTIKWRLRQN